MSIKRRSLLLQVILLLSMGNVFFSSVPYHQGQYDDTPTSTSTSTSGSLRGSSSGPNMLYQPTRKQREKEYEVGLHFFIMGYPKTGTSAMMQFLDSSDELKIVHRDNRPEFNIRYKEDVDLLFDRIEGDYLKSNRDQNQKYGIKWPGAISGAGIGVESIKLIEEYNPEGTETRIIVGLRHPVRWFESFYNYRAKHHVPPPTESLIGSNAWHGVCTNRARFEKGIMQLGKVPLRPQDEQWIEGHEGYGVLSGATSYKVFLYFEEQLHDKDKERNAVFLEELSSFLELKEPFNVGNDAVPEANVNSNKQFDICEPEHDEVRKVLVRNGQKTAGWIRKNLVGAEGFILPNKKHFLSILNTLGTDPCDNVELIS